jgi:N-acyl-D-aspartate/D-glutamate deacylase
VVDVTTTYELAVVGGTVVDGSGLPRRRADVAVKDGRIAAVGFVDAADAEQVVDADGLVVAPGIVDAHTHYDPQLTFEPYATSSCFHGVTTVVAGNCGFSVAPTRAADRGFTTQLFARVEGMSARALEGLPWDFETFPEYLAARRGSIGVNLACYVGHSAVRRWVMGDACQEREATAEEIEAMATVVAEAMAVGAAGFSSSHAPTHFDSHDRPVPSRLASPDEVRALATEAGRHRGGTIAYLPYGSIGGLDDDGERELIDLSLASRMPVIIQGLGARSKVDAPTAGWDNAKRFVDEATAEGAAVYSLLMAKPFNRTFTLAAGTTLYEGVLELNRLFTEATDVASRTAMLRDEAFRAAIRGSVRNPNKDPAKGPTLPPPHWEVLHVAEVVRPEHEKFVGRSLADVAAELGVPEEDAMADLALAEDLRTVFVWRTETPEWREGTRVAQLDPHMIVGTSDGGAHLDRDDGSEFSSYFLRYWVREWGAWTLEEGIRQMTQWPAALLGFADRGMVRPGFAADLMVFDPDTVGPDRKEFVHDFPNGEGRFVSRPTGVHATIVNGTPIVRDGELVQDAGLPGHVLRPGAAFGT